MPPKKTAKAPPNGTAESTRGKPKKGSDEKKAKRSSRPKEKVEVELKPTKEALDEVLAPVQKLVEGLQTQLDAQKQHLDELQPPDLDRKLKEKVGQDQEASEGQPEVTSARENPAIVAKKKVRRESLKVWKSFASTKLADMSTSLDAALVDDAKMKMLFDRIDLDLGGSIDKEELASAMRASNPEIAEAMIDRMLSAADSDGNGDIDFEEFANVIRGVKAHRASFAIQRGVRRHQAKVEGQSIVARCAASKLTKAELDHAFGSALLQRDPKALLHKWDQNHQGSLTRTEFRRGAREDFNLAFDNKDLDEWFDRIDRNGNGQVDLNELSHALVGLKRQVEREKRDIKTTEGEIAALTTKLNKLRIPMDSATAALNAYFEEDSKNAGFRAAPHTNARVGKPLAAKIRSAKNPKAALTLDDVVGMWDQDRNVQGHMDRGEFRSMVHKELGDKPPACPSDSEIDMLFDSFDSDATGSVPIKPCIVAMVGAHAAFGSLQNTSTETLTTVKKSAHEHIEALKTVPSAFIAAEEAEQLAKAASAAAPHGAPAPAPDEAPAGLSPAVSGNAATVTTPPRPEETDPLLRKLAALDGSAGV